ncbi:SET domain-containing protein SmydA-8 [Lepeophtheirus salmonis]|uniref:SET domain-containing protein SmydA-8 n=1 Tax=Lepeophtheirus salmonis TaxID=72036 RepID=UPI001AE2F864|nr:SET domain-containing protein SmydA-8-like [Lepeophtheirus salmonis]
MGKGKKKQGSKVKLQSQESLSNEPRFIELSSSDEEDVQRGSKKVSADKLQASPLSAKPKTSQKDDKKDSRTQKEPSMNLQDSQLKADDKSQAKFTAKDADKSENVEPEKTIPNKVTEEVTKSSSLNIRPENTAQGDCIVCGELAKNFCSSCKYVFYCKREHQKSHWSSHSKECAHFKALPYRIERNPRLGRYLVAKDDISEGSLIFNEPPLVIGPRQLTKAVCLGCHNELKDKKDTYPCRRCTWPMCSRSCSDSPVHANAECSILSYGGVKVNIDAFGTANMMYACITVLRALSLKNDHKWQEYLKFDSHLNERMPTQVYQQVNKEKVVFFIHYFLKLLSKFSDLEILEACGKLDTNCFEIRQFGKNLRGLYRIGSIMSHECTPNTRHTFEENYDINVYSTVDIKKGEIICATYTQPLWCTLSRREHLNMSKCFWCRCKRCADPTEFGTYLSAFSCSECGGKMLPLDPLDQKSNWKCEKCSHTLESTTVRHGIESMMDELKSIDRTNPENLEDFLKRYATLLPETNQLTREIQLGLVSLFKNRRNEDLKTTQLLRKAFMCRQLLTVANRVDPGFSKWRGELLLEMQSANVILGQRALAEGRISNIQAKDIFDENMKHLKEADRVLCIEPEYRDKVKSKINYLTKEIEKLNI